MICGFITHWRKKHQTISTYILCSLGYGYGIFGSLLGNIYNNRYLSIYNRKCFFTKVSFSFLDKVLASPRVPPKMIPFTPASSWALMFFRTLQDLIYPCHRILLLQRALPLSIQLSCKKVFIEFKSL